MGDLIGLALGGTALVFFCCSAYVLTTRKDMSFLGGMLMAGVVVVLIGMVANLFLQLPALHLAISAVFILISSGAILFETSNIIRGGETNYIRATVSLYVSLYNIFVSLLSILGFASRDQLPPLLPAASLMRGLFFATLRPVSGGMKIMFIFEGNEIETDSEGYLKDTTQWSEGDGRRYRRAGRDNARR